MTILLLLALLVITAVEALLGILRGAVRTGIRLVLWIIGSVIAALTAGGLARSILTSLLKASEYEGSTLADMFTNLLGGSETGRAAVMFGVPLAGLSLSLLIPIVFVALYIAVKLLTFLIYLALRFILQSAVKNTKAAPYFTNKETWSKVVGGIVGGLIGIFSCAIIASPISGMVRAIDKSGSVASVFHILETFMDEKTDDATAAVQDKVRDSSLSDRVSDDMIASSLDNAGSYTVSELKSIYNSFVHNPASYVLKFTGSEAASFAIYTRLSQVTPKMLGADGYDTPYYSLPKTVTEFLGIADKIDDTMQLVKSGSGFSHEVIDSVETILFYVIDSDLITDNDKLYMLNSSITSIENAFNDWIGLPCVEFDEHYSTVREFKNDIDKLFDVARFISDIDFSSFTSEGGSNIPIPDETDSDSSLMSEDFVNEVIDNIPAITESVDPSSLTDDQKSGITDLLDALQEEGTIDSDTYDQAYSWLYGTP